MKKEGFTLVELLAIIIILSLILLLYSTSVIKIIKNNKQKMYDLDIAGFIGSTKTWAMDNTSSLPQDNENISISLDMLLKGGYITEIKINPLTNEKYNVNICIFNKNGQYKYELLTANSCNEMNLD